jgi:hypothetical protein
MKKTASVSQRMAIGFVAVSAVWVPFVLGQSLSVAVTAPANGDRYSACSDITVQASVQIQTGEIRSVQFFRNGTSLINDTRQPYETTMKNTPSGVYTLQAKVLDKTGNTAFSDPVVIRVGDIRNGELLLNGGFDCQTWPWAWNIYVAEGSATFTLDSEAWITDDATAAMINVENGGTGYWHIQLGQALPMKAGHAYILNFAAVSSPQDKVIEVTYQQSVSPFTQYFTQLITVDNSGYFGPYEFTSSNDDSTAFLRLNVGLTPGILYLDDVSVVDPSVSAVRESGPAVPGEFGLDANFPNPFNSETRIEYRLAADAAVTLGVFDLRGRRIRTIESGVRTAGLHRAAWDGNDDGLVPVSSGVYFLRLEAASDGNSLSACRKLLLVR